MKYTFTITWEGAGREKLVLESRAGESARHIALKVLAYALFKDDAAPLPLRIEQAVGQRHKPDLVAADPDTGTVRLWIDCGQIETKRLGRIAAANPRARVVVVKPTGNEARLYARAAERFLPEIPERRALIEFLGFEDGFLDDFLTVLRGVNDLDIRRPAPDYLVVTLNGESSTTFVPT
jgi:hypothetical protein